jgi:hypothetical protein
MPANTLNDRHTLKGLGARAARLPRNLVLPALGTLIGFCMAALALLHRLPLPVETVPPGYVAVVNGRGILMSDFITQTMDTTGEPFESSTPEQRAKVLHDMVNEELLVQEALTLDLPETTTEVRDVLVSAVETQVAQPVLGMRVSDGELRAFYEAHKSEFTTSGAMGVTDIVLHVGGYENVDQSTAQAETDATEAAYQLRSGADLRYVMDHFGFVNSGRTDGSAEPDFAAKLHLGDKAYEIARTLTDGQVSDPLVEADGVHLLIMQQRIPERFADFDVVRSKVYAEYRDAQRRQADAQYLQHLRRVAHIVLAPGQSE